jgi:hypothetical protein
MMGRWRKMETIIPPNNKLVQEPEGYEENRSPDPLSTETRINYDKGPNEAHKNT